MCAFSISPRKNPHLKMWYLNPLCYVQQDPWYSCHCFLVCYFKRNTKWIPLTSLPFFTCFIFCLISMVPHLLIFLINYFVFILQILVCFIFYSGNIYWFIPPEMAVVGPGWSSESRAQFWSSFLAGRNPVTWTTITASQGVHWKEAGLRHRCSDVGWGHLNLHLNCWVKRLPDKYF